MKMDKIMEQTVEHHPELYSIPGIPYKERIIPIQRNMAENTEYNLGANVKEEQKISHSLRIICGVLNNHTEMLSNISINQIKIQESLDDIKNEIKILDELDRLQELDYLLKTVSNLTITMNKLTEKF